MVMVPSGLLGCVQLEVLLNSCEVLLRRLQVPRLQVLPQLRKGLPLDNVSSAS